MSRTFNLPDPGEGIHEAEIVTLNVSAGDDVEESQVLMEVETDKALVEIPSPFTGRVIDVLVAEGDRVEVGAPIVEYEEKGVEGETGAEAAEREVGGGARHAAAEATGRGSEGAEERRGRRRAEGGEAVPKARDGGGGELPVPAAPATRRLARELGVELRSVKGTGPAGRVLPDDVRSAAEGREKAAGKPEERPAEGERGGARAPRGGRVEGIDVRAEAEAWGDVEWKPLRSVRRTTAERTSLSWIRSPHVTHFDHADITELDEFRERQAGAVKEAGGSLTLTVFILKAAVAVLKEIPGFNAFLDDERRELGLLHYVNIGVAVDTDRGLLVPVVRHVDSLNLTELAIELVRLTKRARAGQLDRDEMRGGTFTVTNPGPMGGDAFTPIINPPQAAVLGVARASWEPAVREEGGERIVVPRYRLPLCLAFDHRINDGADAARFLGRLVQILEDPDNFIRHL